MTLAPHAAARRQLPGDPVADVETAGAERLHACLEPRQEAVEQKGEADRSPVRCVAEARHRRREVDREVGGGPVGVDADSHHDLRRLRSEPVRLSEDAAELADRAAPEAGPLLPWQIVLDHEIVRPLEADRPVAQPGGVLGGVRHREADRCCQPPRVLGGKPRRAKAEREEQRAPGRCDPGPARAAAPRGLLVGHGEADLRGARRKPRPDNVLGGVDLREALLAGDEGRHRLPISLPAPGLAPRHRAGPAPTARTPHGARSRPPRAGPRQSCR